MTPTPESRTLALPLKDKIVTEIMSLVRQQPQKLPKPTIDELERILNSESKDAVNIEPDGSVSVTPTVTTVGAIADKVVALVEADRAALVLAANSHAPMRAALETAREVIENFPQGKNYIGHTWFNREELLEQIDSALGGGQ